MNGVRAIGVNIAPEMRLPVPSLLHPRFSPDQSQAVTERISLFVDFPGTGSGFIGIQIGVDKIEFAGLVTGFRTVFGAEDAIKDLAG